MAPERPRRLCARGLRRRAASINSRAQELALIVATGAELVPAGSLGKLQTSLQARASETRTQFAGAAYAKLAGIYAAPPNGQPAETIGVRARIGRGSEGRQEISRQQQRNRARRRRFRSLRRASRSARRYFLKLFGGNRPPRGG